MIEMLAILIRSNKNIQGIQIKKIQYLLSMFADNLNMFILNKEKVWKEVQYTILQFEQLSGLRINYDKSTVYRMSSNKSKAQAYSLSKLKWSMGPLEILGTMVHKNDNIMRLENMLPLVDKAEGILRLWKMWGLSLHGENTSI